MAGPSILSLFSGAGGLEVAVRLALPGSRVVGYVERDSYAATALVARMEESSMDLASIFVGEIQNMDGRELRGHVDVVCGGIPCQPYSLAGKQLGNGDDRALWREFARVVGECQPSLVFIENVPTFVTGGGFRPLGEELCRLGYEIASPLFLSAGAVGAPHGRRRVFILAHRDLEGREREWGCREQDEGIRSPQRDDADGCDEGLADTADNNGGSGDSREEAGTRPDGERRRRPSGRGGSVADAERERLQRELQGGSEERATERADRGERVMGEGGISDAIGDEVRVEPERGGGPAREAEPGDATAGDMGGRPRRGPGVHGGGVHLQLRGDDEISAAGGVGEQAVFGLRDGGHGWHGDLHLFPPGPDEADEWRRILGAAPGLAPAVESGFRIVVDGIPVVLDESRADQLRCAGNAVVVLQAHIAFRQLLQWIGGDDEQE